MAGALNQDETIEGVFNPQVRTETFCARAVRVRMDSCTSWV